MDVKAYNPRTGPRRLAARRPKETLVDLSMDRCGSGLNAAASGGDSDTLYLSGNGDVGSESFPCGFHVYPRSLDGFRPSLGGDGVHRCFDRTERHDFFRTCRYRIRYADQQFVVLPHRYFYDTLQLWIGLRTSLQYGNLFDRGRLHGWRRHVKDLRRHTSSYARTVHMDSAAERVRGNRAGWSFVLEVAFLTEVVRLALTRL